MTGRAPAANLPRMIDDVVYSVLGIGLVVLFIYLFVFEPRSSVHPDF